MVLTQYEVNRLQLIESNKLLLDSLGLNQPFSLEKKRKAPVKKRKRKVPVKVVKDEEATDEENDDAEGEERKGKSVKTEEGADAPSGDSPKRETDTSGLRRSSRNAGKKVDYNAEVDRSVAGVTAFKSERVKKTMGSDPRTTNRSVKHRLHDPKRFGPIPGIPVGTWWETREACSIDSVHAPFVAGISPSPKGAFSVALSGGYDDDIDYGEAFTYTGSGGRDLKGTKQNPKNLRTAPQSSDQDFEHNFNKSLLRSVETKNPVRVIRGYKLQSPYAPAEGYRYDGLYVVEKAWLAVGNNPKGYKVCKFVFKRLPNQPPIPEQDDEEDDEDTQLEEESDKGEPTSDDEASEKTETKSAEDEDDELSQVTKVASDCADTSKNGQ